MRISDWSSDVCSSDLEYQKPELSAEERAAFDGAGLKLLYAIHHSAIHGTIASAWKNAGVSDIYITDLKGQIVYSVTKGSELLAPASDIPQINDLVTRLTAGTGSDRSEEHTSELQSLMRNSYAVFCLQTTT